MTPVEQDESLARFERLLERSHREAMELGVSHAMWASDNAKAMRFLEGLNKGAPAAHLFIARMKRIYAVVEARLEPRH